jgi:LPXTG-motif cell wall-anchored protein
MRRYRLAAALAATATVLFTGVAAADTPVSGDDRATAHAGNVVAKDCAELVPGSHEVEPTFSVDDTNTYLDVTGKVVAVVVKGGPAYNLYLAAGEDLHAPLVSSGKPAQISHWFACGSIDTDTETSTTSTTDTTTETTATETTSSAPASSSADSVTTTATTTQPSVAPAAAEGELAATGVESGWLVVLATALLAGGGALLLLGRRRATRR